MTFVSFRLYSGESRGGHRPRGTQTDFEEVPMNDIDTVGGYSVPVDPMDDLQCESCQ
jgi:hypothetical protein